MRDESEDLRTSEKKPASYVIEARAKQVKFIQSLEIFFT